MTKRRIREAVFFRFAVPKGRMRAPLSTVMSPVLGLAFSMLCWRAMADDRIDRLDDDNRVIENL